jgi:photosystem II stability/assembly factor-like uncharacterized protein
MRNSVSAFAVFSFIIFLTTTSFGQDNKYIRKNDNAPVIQYTTDRCYSRSILVTDSVVYTANSNGTLYASHKKNKTNVNLLKNKKFEEMRDLALSNGEIIGMQSGTYGVLARTNGQQFLGYIAPGSLWVGTFLDGMDIKGQAGFMMGDPKDGIFSLFHSVDGGKTWKPCEGKVAAFEKEAGFAASGTNVQVLNDSTFYFVSGGLKSRFFKTENKGKTWEITSLPYMGNESTGAFSICMLSKKVGVIVGGDYANPDLSMNTCFYTTDGGKFWLNAEIQTRGYRSCVIHVNGIFYSCGTNGIDYSIDNGVTWIPFANGEYFALASDGTSLYATMKGGQYKIMGLVSKK